MGIESHYDILRFPQKKLWVLTSNLTAFTSIAVVDFISGNFCTIQEASIMTDAFRNEIVRSRKANVIDRSNIHIIMRELNFQSSDWVNPNNIKTAGNLLGADYLIFGNFGIMDGRGYLQVQMTEVLTGLIIHSSRLTLSNWQEFDRRVNFFASEFIEKIPMPNIFTGTWNMTSEIDGNINIYNITFLSNTSCTVRISTTINGRQMTQQSNGNYFFDGTFFRLSVNFINPSIPNLQSIQWVSVLQFNTNNTAFHILVPSAGDNQKRVTFIKE